MSSNRYNWQKEFQDLALGLSIDLIVAHRAMIWMPPEEKEKFDRTMNRAHKRLTEMVATINPEWISDADETGESDLALDDESEVVA